MDCFIGLDIGTSAIKGVLLSQNGEIIATESGEFHYSGEKGQYLMEPREFLRVSLGVLNKLATWANSQNNIVAICPCCASGNLILLDGEYNPITPIIGWQNEISQAQLDGYYTENERNAIYKKVGWPVVTGFPIAYLPWLKENKKELLQNARMICMSAEYLNFVLTGKWGISPSMATPFYITDQENGVYNKDLIAHFGITEQQLPPIYEKGTILGKTVDGLGIPKDIPVVLGSFDHPACATGAGVYAPNELLLSCGTSWVEFFPVESRQKAIETNLLVDRYMLDGAPYCVMNSITSLGQKINLLRERYLKGISHQQLDLLILESKKGANGLVFDFTNADFERGKGFSKPDIARAIFESAARLLKQRLEETESLGLKASKITMVGGMTNSEVCMSIIAEALGKQISVVNGVSAGAVGAAMLGAIGVKVFKNEKEAFYNMNFKVKKY